MEYVCKTFHAKPIFHFPIEVDEKFKLPLQQEPAIAAMHGPHSLDRFGD